jgi:antitoxin component YwqK of YwqJK toxin-antitoxin module
MKSTIYLAGLTMSLAVASCVPTPRQTSEVVRQTYVHKYGVTVPEQDWSTRGKNGQIVTEMKNGVTVSRSFSSGVIDGPTSYTFPHSSSIEKLETYARGNLLKEVTHYRSGPPMQEIDYTIDGTKKVTTWFENGTPKSLEEFDMRGALVKADYFTPTHQVEAQVDNKHGIRISRNQYGHIVSKDTIENGVMTVRTTYHYNGTPKEIVSYKEGVNDGKRQTFLPDGEPNTIEEWKRGKQDGISILFQNGEKYSETPYVEGKKHGIEKRYRDGSELTQEISWYNDLQEGPTKVHAGDIATTEWYYEGRPVSRLDYDGLIRANRKQR